MTFMKCTHILTFLNLFAHTSICQPSGLCLHKVRFNVKVFYYKYTVYIALSRHTLSLRVHASKVHNFPTK